MRIFLQLLVVVFLHFMTLALPKQAVCDEKTVTGKTYQDIMLLLDKGGDFLSYNHLLEVHETITATEDSIPGMEKILHRLMKKRNENPRVDQMILIVAAQLIGSSKQELAEVNNLFKALIFSDRANLWTVGFAAAALGDYFIDLEDGDHLADLIDSRIERLIENERTSPEESYGFHFLPPPTTDYIKNIISDPEKQKRRELTRRYYYMLRLQNSEEQIKSYLLFLEKHGEIDSQRKIDFTMRYLLTNIERIKAAAAKKRKDELSSQ